jgi:hypothetical protein
LGAALLFKRKKVCRNFFQDLIGIENKKIEKLYPCSPHRYGRWVGCVIGGDGYRVARGVSLTFPNLFSNNLT